MENTVAMPEEVKFLLESYYTYCIEVIIGKPAEQWDEKIKKDLLTITNRAYNRNNNGYYDMSPNERNYVKSFRLEKGKYKSAVIEQTSSSRILKNMLDFNDYKKQGSSGNGAADIVARYQSDDNFVQSAFLKKWESIKTDNQLCRIGEMIGNLRDQRNGLCAHNTDTISENRRNAYLYSAIYFINLFKALSDVLSEESDQFINWSDPDGEHQKMLDYYDGIANQLKGEFYQDEKDAGEIRSADIVFSYRTKKYYISKEREDDYRDLIVSMARDWKVMRDHFLNKDFLNKFKEILVGYTGDTYSGIQLDRLCERLSDAVERSADGEVVIILTMMINLFLPDIGFYIRGRYVSDRTIAEKLLYIPFLVKRGDRLTWETVINNIDESSTWAPWGDKADRNGLGLSLKSVAYYHVFSTYYELAGNKELKKQAKEWESCILDLAEREKKNDEDDWCTDANQKTLRMFAYMVNGQPFYISLNNSGKRNIFRSMDEVRNHFQSMTELELIADEVTRYTNDANFMSMIKYTNYRNLENAEKWN